LDWRVVFSRWPMALAVLRFAGAAYLGWLGLVSLYRAARFADGGLPMLTVAPAAATSLAQQRGSFRQGLTVNILNPAIATFYLIVVPSFLPSARRVVFRDARRHARDPRLSRATACGPSASIASAASSAAPARAVCSKGRPESRSLLSAVRVFLRN
jgi:hypothetical protein